MGTFRHYPASELKRAQVVQNYLKTAPWITWIVILMCQEKLAEYEERQISHFMSPLKLLPEAMEMVEAPGDPMPKRYITKRRLWPIGDM